MWEKYGFSFSNTAIVCFGFPISDTEAIPAFCRSAAWFSNNALGHTGYGNATSSVKEREAIMRRLFSCLLVLCSVAIATGTADALIVTFYASGEPVGFVCGGCVSSDARELLRRGAGNQRTTGGAQQLRRRRSS